MLPVLTLILYLRVNVFSIWRLATIVEHRAATWPTKDPTWYSPISILLAVLEVDCASICASVPIFWPALVESWGMIFVTKEITVTHEHRLDRLRGHSSMGFDLSNSGSHSRAGSETELRIELKEQKSSRDLHYADEFVIGQVDPLRRSNSISRNAQVRIETERDRKKWFEVG